MGKTIAKVAVCGAGAMGCGIAQVAAQAGVSVIVFDVQQTALAAGERRNDAALSMLTDKGKLSAAATSAIKARIVWTPDLTALAEADLVIEAIVEDAAIKSELFGRIEALVRPDAIIASNTSSLPITRLARQLAHPDRFLGMHFFNPAPVMKLVEVVAGAATAPWAIDSIQSTARAWGKVAIATADVPGFIVNRVARPFYGEAFMALGEAAAGAATIDALMRGAGFRMGPLELSDLIGQDVNFAVARSIHDASFGQTRFMPQQRQAALVDAGWLGRKSGRGVYHYSPPEPPAAAPDAQPSLVAFAIDPRIAQTALHRISAGWDEPFVPCEGVLIGLTRGRSARNEAAAAAQPCALLDWFDAAGDGPIGYAGSDDRAAATAAGLLQSLARAGHRIADRPGLIVMRSLAQIANAAADAVLEQVADESGIDEALRFGANYPFGPFAWMDRTGRAAVVAALQSIADATGKAMYCPSEYLRRTS